MLLPHVGHQKYQFLLQSAVLSSFYSPAVIVVVTAEYYHYDLSVCQEFYQPSQHQPIRTIIGHNPCHIILPRSIFAYNRTFSFVMAP